MLSCLRYIRRRGGVKPTLNLGPSSSGRSTSVATGSVTGKFGGRRGSRFRAMASWRGRKPHTSISSHMEHSILPSTEAGSQAPSVMPELASTVADSFRDELNEELGKIWHPLTQVTDSSQIPDESRSAQRDSFHSHMGDRALSLSIEDQHGHFYPPSPHTRLIGQHATLPAVSGPIVIPRSRYTGYVYDGSTASSLSGPSGSRADSFPPAYERDTQLSRDVPQVAATAVSPYAQPVSRHERLSYRSCTEIPEKARFRDAFAVEFEKNFEKVANLLRLRQPVRYEGGDGQRTKGLRSYLSNKSKNFKPPRISHRRRETCTSNQGDYQTPSR